jgi:hypothetical protein
MRFFVIKITENYFEFSVIKKVINKHFLKQS